MSVRTEGWLMTARNYSALANRDQIKSARMFMSDKRVDDNKATVGGQTCRSIEDDDVWAERTSSSDSLAAPTAVLVCRLLSQPQGEGGPEWTVGRADRSPRSGFLWRAPTWLRTKASPSLFHHPLPPVEASHSGPQALCIQTPPPPALGWSGVLHM